MAVWAKIVAVFVKNFWGGFWRALAPKVAVSDLEQLTTLVQTSEESKTILDRKLEVFWEKNLPQVSHYDQQ